MSDCTVTCHECPKNWDGPRRWHWLCETCAQECADEHRRTTGHCVDLAITTDDITPLIRRASRSFYFRRINR